ncbi:MAG TPA: MBL fold metallo-hydrolase [Vicinamibacterales bacterium]|nr:MBL fold metallo-hydrolase [Vicinamibacterales bacterium]
MTAARATALAPLARLATLNASVQGGGAAAAPQVSQTGMRLVLLGTQGGPNVNTRRAQGSNALVVDGRQYLVDCGYGAVRSLVAAGLGIQQLNTAFITHLHDDHMADVAALLSLQWTGAKRQPTDIYGPFGTAAMVEAALAFTRANTEIRMTDEGRTIRPEQLFHGHDVPAQATPLPVFKDDRLTVTAVESTHYPDRAKATMPYRALAYRFDADARSVVITGDTAYSKNIVGLARGADLFVCEIIDQPQYDTNLAAAARARAAGNDISVAQHVVETHSNNEVVGRMASEAGVKTVVLTHLLPGSNRPDAAEYPDSSYIDGVRKFFAGEVIVGRDLMVL